MPEEDMPCSYQMNTSYTMLNPLGCLHVWNIGQVLELHLSAARIQGIYIATPVFDGAQDEDVWGTVAEAGMARDAKTIYMMDGEPFDKPCVSRVKGYDQLAHMV